MHLVVVYGFQGASTDNLNVVRRVSGILAGGSGRRPCELSTDGDLLTHTETIVRCRGVDSVRISEVKGHADA